MDKLIFEAIGCIHSPHTITEKTPIQPVYAERIRGTITIDKRYEEGLQDLDGFSHIHLIYAFHEATEVKLKVRPDLEDQMHSIFATRAPFRPNRVGFSIVKSLSIEGTTLHIEDVDILDGTPLLDIEPYVARFDIKDNVRSGWQDHVSEDEAQVRGKRNYGE